MDKEIFLFVVVAVVVVIGHKTKTKQAMECPYCSSGQQHPFFVSLYAVSADAANKLGRNASSRISGSRHPKKLLLEFNRQLQRRGSSSASSSTAVAAIATADSDRDTDRPAKRRKTGAGGASAAAKWVLVCTVGPFFDGRSVAFKKAWQLESRKEAGRLMWAVMNSRPSVVSEGDNRGMQVFVNSLYREMLAQQLAKTPEGRSLLNSYMPDSNTATLETT